MSEGRQTVAGAYQAIEAHEKLCAERYRGINQKLGWVLSGLAMLFVGLLTWAFVQLYALEPLRIAAAHQAGRSDVSVQVNPPAARPEPPTPAKP